MIRVNVANLNGSDLNIVTSYEVRSTDRTKECTRTTKYNPTNE